MAKLEIKSGEKYGRLTIVEEVKPYVYPSGKTKRRFSCKCDCGNITNVVLNNLKRGFTNSCGCFNQEKSIERVTTHGLRYHHLYPIWAEMKQRCCNSNHKRYKDYGGRGISICDRWVSSFENFLQDMGNRPEGTSIDRINNDGNYEPSNCRWADDETQRNNKRVMTKKTKKDISI